MGLPFMLEQAGLGVDVAELIGVRAGREGAVLRVAAVIVLRPETVEDECIVAGAFGGFGVRVAELGRPGEIEKVKVEARGACERACGAVIHGRSGVGSRLAGGEDDDESRDEGESGELHAGKDSRGTRDKGQEKQKQVLPSG